MCATDWICILFLPFLFLKFSFRFFYVARWLTSVSLVARTATRTREAKPKNTKKVEETIKSAKFSPWSLNRHDEEQRFAEERKQNAHTCFSGESYEPTTLSFLSNSSPSVTRESLFIARSSQALFCFLSHVHHQHRVFLDFPWHNKHFFFPQILRFYVDLAFIIDDASTNILAEC